MCWKILTSLLIFLFIFAWILSSVVHFHLQWSHCLTYKSKFNRKRAMQQYFNFRCPLKMLCLPSSTREGEENIMEDLWIDIQQGQSTNHSPLQEKDFSKKLGVLWQKHSRNTQYLGYRLYLSIEVFFYSEHHKNLWSLSCCMGFDICKETPHFVV